MSAMTDFMPHGQCFLWKPELVWLHTVSDSIIALSYYSIPLALGYFVYKRRDLPFNWMFLMFGLFILACGTTHVMGIWTIWRADYWLDGTIKAMTAGVSVVTAGLLWPLLPKALAIPSVEQFETANRDLRREIAERQRAEAETLSLNIELERRVAERTAQLETANRAIQADMVERQRSEERFRLVVEGAPIGMVMINSSGTIMLVNPQIERLFGYARAELVGQSIEVLVPERLRNEHSRHRQGFFASPSTRAMGTGRDLYGLRKDGAEFPVEIGLNPIDTSEGLVVMASIIDISERKRAQREIQQLNEELEKRVTTRTAELTSVNRELEAFSYSVSHDLRAPLRSMQGFSQALMEDYGNKLDDVGNNYLERIRSASERLARLIDDLLSLSQITRREIRRETIHLSALAESIAHDLRDASPERRVQFTIEQGLMVYGDPRLIRIVMENLIGNAWKYTSKHDRAHIQVGMQPLADGTLAYFVRDDGAGFDMVYAEKLFGAFQRLHHAKDFAGTGIGLATVHRIVQRHGGRVWGEGKVENGATFYFTLQ